MGWQKGKKRGPSPLSGKRQFGVDPKYVELLLADETQPPEVRFCAVMEVLIAGMEQSTVRNLSAVGHRLRTFWEHDMDNTEMWTPEVREGG